MFVYVLITAELAILYAVFWYLYLRDPLQRRNIVGETWGSYGESALTTCGAEENQYQPCYAQTASQQVESQQVLPFMVPVYDELTLDVRTSRYVPLPRKQANVFSHFVENLDCQLSTLNVRP